MTTPLIILILLVLVLTALIVMLMYGAAQARRELAAQNACVSLIQQQLDAIKFSGDSLRQTTETSLQKGREDIAFNLRSQQETLARLNMQLGELSAGSKRIAEVGTDIRRLETILSSPKLRGQLGEWSLYNLLADILPAGSFARQHQFRNGRTVDALVQMPDYSIPIDAKFPLPAFEAVINAPDDDARGKARKRLYRDVVTHIDKIADSYIRPAEGTLDFALMYIPAENVYYEAVNASDGDASLMQYALARKVIPVSPSLLYAYLMTVAMGLNGLQIEKQAALIRANLKKLNGSFADFAAKWELLGKHMRNAQNQYEEGNTRFTRLGTELEQIQLTDDDQLPLVSAGDN